MIMRSKHSDKNADRALLVLKSTKKTIALFNIFDTMKLIKKQKDINDKFDIINIKFSGIKI